jgi:hypothetical protein
VQSSRSAYVHGERRLLRLQPLAHLLMVVPRGHTSRYRGSYRAYKREYISYTLWMCQLIDLLLQSRGLIRESVDQQADVKPTTWLLGASHPRKQAVGCLVLEKEGYADPVCAHLHLNSAQQILKSNSFRIMTMRLGHIERSSCD